MGAGIKKKGVSEPDSLLPFGLLESPPPVEALVVPRELSRVRATW